LQSFSEKRMKCSKRCVHIFKVDYANAIVQFSPIGNFFQAFSTRSLLKTLVYSGFWPIKVAILSISFHKPLDSSDAHRTIFDRWQDQQQSRSVHLCIERPKWENLMIKRSRWTVKTVQTQRETTKCDRHKPLDYELRIFRHLFSKRKIWMEPIFRPHAQEKKRKKNQKFKWIIWFLRVIGNRNEKSDKKIWVKTKLDEVYLPFWYKRAYNWGTSTQQNLLLLDEIFDDYVD